MGVWNSVEEVLGNNKESDQILSKGPDEFSTDDRTSGLPKHGLELNSEILHPSVWYFGNFGLI